MDITYLGHSCFKLRGSSGSVVTDPFNKKIGIPLPKVSADVVTVSHQHYDHNNVTGVMGTARREQPLVINSPGEYEVAGISVFGYKSFHDKKQGAERGDNTIYVIHIDGVRVGHMGDLGQVLGDKLVEQIDGIDVLLCPVGGVYTIDPSEALKLAAAIQPSIFVPMHFRASYLDQSSFGKLATVEDFLKEAETDAQRTEKLTVTPVSLPEEMEIVILER